jgi:hypothetical protein
VQGFLGYTLFKRDKHSFGPSMHGAIERNCGQWLFKRLNSRSWQIIFTMMQKEEPMFASGDGVISKKRLANLSPI